MNIEPKTLRMAQLTQYLGLSKATIYERLREGSSTYDPTFPKQVSLGGRAKGWLRSDIDAWSHARKGLGTSVTPSPSAAPQDGPTASQTQPHRTPRRGSLGEVVMRGSDIVSRVDEYLRLNQWTPAMGCMMVHGVAPEIGATSIPESARGLDDQVLDRHHDRLLAARRLLDLWNDEEQPSPPDHSKPFDFLLWCFDSQVHGAWFDLVWAINGGEAAAGVDLTAAHVAMLVRA